MGNRKREKERVVASVWDDLSALVSQRERERETSATTPGTAGHGKTWTAEPESPVVKRREGREGR